MSCLNSDATISIQKVGNFRSQEPGRGAFPIISLTTMAGTPSMAPNVGSERLDTFARRFNSEPPIERVGRFELLNDVTGRKLRVLRNSPRPPLATSCFSASDDNASGGASDNDKAFHHKSSCSVNHPHLSFERVGRVELLNDVAGRQRRVFRNSPRPPLARSSSNDSDDASDGASDNDKDFHHKSSYSLNDSHPPLERVGRFESLNDVTGRKLRVFRISPRPSLARISSPASDNDASDGASDTECSSDAAGFELKESPCLHLEMRASLVDCNVG